jgi:aerobic-type carbon monoxide dehydrogenase small subunit (CoxS/CutS family)
MKKEERQSISLTVNDETYKLYMGLEPGEVAPSQTLAQTLRDNLGLTGVKIGCDHGACGCCTVIVDEEAFPSCMMLTVECDGKSITTIEGLEDPKTGELDPLQQSFIDNAAFQCGFCTPGIIMTSKALLDKNPYATETEIKEALAGNYCRCGSHYQVLEAVKQSVEKRGKCKCQMDADI